VVSLFKKLSHLNELGKANPLACHASSSSRMMPKVPMCCEARHISTCAVLRIPSP
jgi:hypothetical protein